MEMSLLRNINPHMESEEYKQWRLQVKQRLYNHNIVRPPSNLLIKDALAQLDKKERVDKLQQTFKGVEDDYLRLLRVGSNGFNGEHVDTDEEEDDVGPSPSKRVRLR
jgi:hypothetical protein